MQPRPPNSWPSGPPRHPGPRPVGADQRPWRPPRQEFERDMAGHGYRGEEYNDGGHCSSSQYYHPEKQRRHQQPEAFWFSRPPPPPPPPPPDFVRPWQSQSNPHWSGQQKGGDRDPIHPPPPRPLFYPTESSVVEREQYIPEQDLQQHNHPPPPPPPPHPPPPNQSWPTGQPEWRNDAFPSEIERTSSVDLIKSRRTDIDGDNHHGNQQISEEVSERYSHEPMYHGHPIDQIGHQQPPQVGGGGGVREESLREGEEVVTEGLASRERLEEKEEEEEDEEMDNYEDSFTAEVRRFVQRSATTFDLVTKEELVMDKGPTLHNFRSEASFKYAEPEALEYHMQVPLAKRRNAFFKLVETGDVVKGHVVAKRYSGLAVQITSFVNSHKYRELSDLSVKGIVAVDNLAEDKEKCEDVLKDMQMNDVVQAEVVTVDHQEETVILTFCTTSGISTAETPSLGYKPGKRPVTPRPSDVVRDSEFLDHLEGDTGFINPGAVENIYQVLGLATATSFKHTFFTDLQMMEYSEEDYAGSLRKMQRFKWSMKTVAVGVGHFKSGKHKEARQVLDHALDIDPSNVEGLVARGALLATTGHYKNGIADFHKALSLKSTHKNARNYLVETSVVYGKRLEEQGRIDAAVSCYREALDFDPGEETAKARLEALMVAMETKTARQREKERQEEEEQEKLARVRRVIEKEKLKRLKEKKSKRKKDRERKKKKRRQRRRSEEEDKKNKKKKKASKKKNKRRTYYTSSSSSGSEDSLTDGETETSSDDDDDDDSDDDDGGRRRKRKKTKEKQQRERRGGHRKSQRKPSSTDSTSSSSSDYDSESDEREKPAASSRRRRKRSKYSSEEVESSSERGQREKTREK